MAPASINDQAVREYLLFLEDPEQLVDHAHVQSLQEKVDGATDPLDRLIALAAFERARHPAEETLRRAFIEHAPAWADAHDVPAGAFKQLGVPDEVLREAGLSTKSGTRQPRNTSRRKSTTADELKAAIASMKGPFTSQALADAAGGGSPMTVRKALSEAESAGAVRRLGPDPEWGGRGRAPILYESIS